MITFNRGKNGLIPAILSTLIFVIAWEIAAIELDKPEVLPQWNILLTKTFGVVSTGQFFLHMGLTIVRGLAGFMITLTMAWSMATVSFYSPFMKSFFQPWVLISRTIPVIALALIALLWFSPPNLPVFISIITMFPILYQGILSGLENADRSLMGMAYSFGKGKNETYWKIVIPQAWKLGWDSLSTGLGFGWRAVIIGEVLAHPANGMGTQMKTAQLQVNMPELLAWTIWAILLSYVFDIGVRYLGKKNPSFLDYSKFPGIIMKKPNSEVHKPGYISVTNATDTIGSKQKSEKGDLKNNFCTELPCIEIQDLCKSYPGKVLYDNFNCRYESFSVGGIHLLNAPSGWGKTTLLDMISGLKTADKGKIQFSGKLRIGYSFQDLRLIPWLTVKENILFCATDVQRDELENIMVQLGLYDQKDYLPAQISGGQQQMLALGRTLASKPNLILLDEPLRGLDDPMKDQVKTFLKEWFQKYDPIVIWATHEVI